MTDLEIDKALALAIGWPEHLIDAGRHYCTNKVALCIKPKVYPHEAAWKFFSHKDWNVIGPIAERYDCFPEKHWQGPPYDGWLAGKLGIPADTPQKAIALAVIQGAKK